MKPRDEVDYEAKAVKLAGRRYIVCRNRDQMKKDAADRAAIIAALEKQLKKGDKSLVGNKGYRRYLANPEGDGFSIDRAKVEEDAKFDGGFVLRTYADLSPLEAMLVYKQLWTVDIHQAWRLSRFSGWGKVFADGRWRDPGPGGRVARMAFRSGDCVGIGEHEHCVFRSAADCAAG